MVSNRPALGPSPPGAGRPIWRLAGNRRRNRCGPMHADYLGLSQALLHWSRRQPSEIAIKAELLAFGLELLSKHPDYIPLRRLIKMNAADLVTSVQHGDRRFSP